MYVCWQRALLTGDKVDYPAIERASSDGQSVGILLTLYLRLCYLWILSAATAPDIHDEL